VLLNSFRVAGPCDGNADSKCISCGSLQNPYTSELINKSAALNNALLTKVLIAVQSASVQRWLPWLPSYANVTQLTLLRTTGAMCDNRYAHATMLP
jgi:hypothetical protein